MTTTFQYRELAAAAEKALDWTYAAQCWNCAIEAYPAAISKGELAKRDLANMTRRRNEARKMADAEIQECFDDVNWVGHPMHY